MAAVASHPGRLHLTTVYSNALYAPDIFSLESIPSQPLTKHTSYPVLLVEQNRTSTLRVATLRALPLTDTDENAELLVHLEHNTRLSCLVLPAR